MVSEVSGAAAAQATQPSAAAQGWPARSAAYYGLAVIICATMLNFLDAQVFGIMAQRIKVDFHLTDEQLGFLIGPANIIFYVLVGIPMARLVDIYPRKIILAGGITLIGGITALGGWHRPSRSYSAVACWWGRAARRTPRARTRCWRITFRPRGSRGRSASCSWGSSAAIPSACILAGC
jgi:MFS family permease